MELASACFGGGGNKGEVGLDTGEGVDELTDEQLSQIRQTLGESDFNRLYGHLL